jgi:hypothetical protein
MQEICIKHANLEQYPKYAYNMAAYMHNSTLSKPDMQLIGKSKNMPVICKMAARICIGAFWAYHIIAAAYCAYV